MIGFFTHFALKVVDGYEPTPFVPGLVVGLQLRLSLLEELLHDKLGTSIF